MREALEIQGLGKRAARLGLLPDSRPLARNACESRMASTRRTDTAMEIKIRFELQQGENGYPPDRWETVWANEVQPGVYAIDNIPFFVRGISSEDVVEAKDDGGGLSSVSWCVHRATV